MKFVMKYVCCDFRLVWLEIIFSPKKLNCKRNIFFYTEQAHMIVHNQTGLNDIGEPNSFYSLGDEIKPIISALNDTLRPLQILFVQKAFNNI